MYFRNIPISCIRIKFFLRITVHLPVSGRALLIRVEKNPRMLVATRDSPSRLRPPPGACCPRVSTVVPLCRCTVCLGLALPFSREHSSAAARDVTLTIWVQSCGGGFQEDMRFTPPPRLEERTERHRLGGESRRHPQFTNLCSRYLAARPNLETGPETPPGKIINQYSGLKTVPRTAQGEEVNLVYSFKTVSECFLFFAQQSKVESF